VSLASITHNLVYGSNLIESTRYTAFSFIPVNLMQQLRRSSIIWFLITGILQATFSNLYAAEDWVTLIVIAFMILFTVSKNLTQDILRIINDRRINSHPVEVWNGTSFTQAAWKDLKVGNLVCLKTGDTAPADLIVLSGSLNGTCLADLKLLTGKKNLSEKTAVRETQILLEGWKQRPDLLSKLEGDLLIPQPTSDISKFEGKLRLKGYPRAAPLSIANFIPRDSLILKTESLLCLAVYVGPETKMMLNPSSSSGKHSRLEARLNRVSYFIIGVTVALSIICAAVSEDMVWDDDLNFGEHFVSYILLYQHVIPITLFFLLDAIRLIQLVLIQRTKRFKMTTGDVNDEIGQVEYVLTDKTGTLTNAELKMRMCKVGNIEYVTETDFLPDSEESMDDLVKHTKNSTISFIHSNSQPFTTLTSKSDNDKNQLFLLSLLLCNTVYPQPNGELLAESADEIAMVRCAESCGYKLLERTANRAKVLIKGTAYEYVLHAVIPFSSETRRMSTLVQLMGYNRAFLMIKGAPDVMRQLCNIDPDNEDELEDEEDEQSFQKCLRSIVLACKQLNDVDTLELVESLDYSRGNANEEGRVVAALADYEDGLSMLGTAFLEETVRPNVAETIQRLKTAGVKIWMVTGDSSSSAYSAAVSSRLTSLETDHLTLVNYISQFDLKRNLTKSVKRCIYGEYDDLPLSRLASMVSPTSGGGSTRSRNAALEGLKKSSSKGQTIFKSIAVTQQDATEFLEEPFESNFKKFTMTIDGLTLKLALEDNVSRKILTCLLFSADSVLACNMLPSHKADLVKLLQRNLVFKPRVLAVGDGNNDISMLRQANVGVGISEHFSSQAANSSDIMAKDFTDLSDLILNHGLKAHSSLAKSLLLAFYGNMTMTLVLFYFSFTADNSSASMFEPLLSASYCLFFFILPLAAIGSTDNSSYASKAVAYKKSCHFRLFAKRLILKYVMLSVLHSGILFLYVYPCFWAIVNDDGQTETIELIGITMFIAICLTTLLQSTFEVRTAHPAYIIAFAFNIVIIFLFSYIISLPGTTTIRLESSFSQLESSPPAIIVMLCAPASCFSISLILRAFTKSNKSSKVVPEKSIGRIADYTAGLNQVYRNYKGWNVDKETEVYKIDRFTVKFKSAYTEIKYMNFYYSYQIRAIRVSVGILAVVAVVYTLVAAGQGDSDVAATLLRALFALMLISILIWTCFAYFKKVYVRAIIFLISVAIFGKFILEILANTDGALAASFTPPYIFTLFCVDYVIISCLSFCNIILTQISQAVLLESLDTEGEAFALVILRLLVLTLGISTISAAEAYSCEVNNRERYKLIEVSQQEVQKTQSILSFLLPAFVKERVKEGARYIAEDQGTVTIVFCDIYDFDRICAEYTPSELTDFLDDLFRKFDKLCDIHGVTKIETVGKTYMACSGLKDSEADMPAHMLLRSHARRGVDMALDCIRTVKNMKLKYGEPLKVKIGINSGPVTAGVVGYHKPQFALVGDTVNTASRMCATLAEANSIQITAKAYEMLNRYEGLEFTDNQVEAKGKGLMQTKIVRENKSGGALVFEKPMLALDTTLAAHPAKTQEKQNTSENPEQILTRKGTELISKIFSCQCSETEKQKEFRVNLLEHSFRVMFAGVGTSLAVNSLLLLFSILEYVLLDNYAGIAQIITRAIMTILVAVLMGFMSKIYKTNWYLALTSALSIFQAVVALMNLIEDSEMEVTLSSSEIIFALLFLSHSTGLFFIRVVPISVLILALWLGIAVDDATGVSYIVPSLYIAFVILVNCFAVYYRESNMRTFANLKLIVDKENEKTEKLLSYMMPAHVYENLKEDRAVTDKLPSVSLLFADICGFTAWSSDKTPIEVVGMLSELFTSFDILCVRFNVFKVCTIGDCYVVMGYNGLEHKDPGDECSRLLEFAFEMIQTIKDLNAKHKSELNMRIGLHLGEVIAGITGTNIVRYDIYGPDVLIANKMESGGQPGRINVSDVVRYHVETKHPHKYTYEFNSEISAKSVGRTHKSYFVTEVHINQLS